MIKKYYLTALLLILSSASIFSQETGEDRFGSWLTYFGNHRFAENWSIFTELQLNDYQFLDNYNQFWGFLGLTYRIDPNTTVGAGYSYFNTDVTFRDIPGQKNVSENRIYENFNTRNSLGKFNLHHRYRLEQRFFSGDPKVRHRMRYRILITHPVKGSLFAQVFEEVFINFQQPTFDQNRVFAGFGYRFSNSINLRAGYLKVHFSSTKYDRLQVFLNINTDLRKKEKEPKSSLP